MARIKVLVFPCGSENGSEIYQALMHSIHVELHGASSIDDHGELRFERYRGGLPRISEAGFDEAFTELVREWGIILVFATHDSVQEYLAGRTKQFGIQLVNGDPYSVRLARRKTLTYELFADRPWSHAVYHNVSSVTQWPAVVKPDLGQGGQGVCIVDGPAAAKTALEVVDEPLLVEYLPGEEITVDCFTDRNGNLLWIGPRTRERVKAGISMRSRHLEVEPEVRIIAIDINRSLTLRGPWFFQLKRNREGDWKLLEFSCRVAGTMVAQRAKGINLPLMAVLDYLDRDLLALPEERVSLVERRIKTFAVLNHEFHRVFIDFDETLVLNGRAVSSTMRFVYRMLERSKELILITRHEGSLVKAMEEARISPFIFSEIIHLTSGEPKSQFVTENSIFVDNHFPERLDVARVCGIPVFDVDALEFFN